MCVYFLFFGVEHSLSNINGETTKQQHRRQPKLCLGDLNSGRAFDNNCVCFESVNGFRRRECTCNVRHSRISLMIIGSSLSLGSKISPCPRIDDSVD